MRVSPRELKAVRAGGLVTRYAVFGDAVFAIVDLPAEGSAGTAMEDPCREEHWALVLQGEFVLEGRRPRVFGPGTAFHVAPGAVHRLRGSPRATIATFQPLTTPMDEAAGGLDTQDADVLTGALAPALPPTTMKVAGSRAGMATTGRIQTESAVMGDWLFTRTTFGEQSGYADGWCDLPHWGLVLDGSLLLHWENGEIELLGRGDVFYCPADGPGHRIEVADVATIVDYTPVAAIDDGRLRRAPRALAARSAVAAARIPRPTDPARPADVTDEDRAGVS